MNILLKIILKIVATGCIFFLDSSLNQWAKGPEEQGYGTDRNFWAVCTILSIIIIWVL